jgi:hypothetical protein
VGLSTPAGNPFHYFEKSQLCPKESYLLKAIHPTASVPPLVLSLALLPGPHRPVIFSPRGGQAASKTLAWKSSPQHGIPIVGFTAAQEVGLELFITRSYSASHTGGTAVDSTAAGKFKKKATNNDSAFAATAIQISGTGALTNGTHTIDAVAIAANQFAELAAAVTVPKGRFCLEWSDGSKGRIILKQDEGLILRNQIAMGAAGTARVTVCLEWEEFTA